MEILGALWEMIMRTSLAEKWWLMLVIGQIVSTLVMELFFGRRAEQPA